MRRYNISIEKEGNWNECIMAELPRSMWLFKKKSWRMKYGSDEQDKNESLVILRNTKNTLE